MQTQLYNYFLPACLCCCKLSCEEGRSGPSHESMQAVFDLQPFRPAVNLSSPTITNISFTLYAVLGVVSSQASTGDTRQNYSPKKFAIYPHILSYLCTVSMKPLILLIWIV